MADGLNKISNCDNVDRKADVIFIHGLGGDAYGTWKKDGKDENYWPEWLGEELPYAGVWSLQYSASPTAWKGTTMPMYWRAGNVLEKMKVRQFGVRPIIFVCHSLGGLLAKQILRTAYDSSDNKYKQIAEKTCGIVFIATPHSGSNHARFLEYLKIFSRPTETIEELEADNPRLMELNSWFKKHENTKNIKLSVYFETKSTKNVGIIVDNTSADPGIENVNLIPMDEDHLSICKPKDRDSDLYLGIKQLIEEVLAFPVTQSSKNGNDFDKQANTIFHKKTEVKMKPMKIFISYSRHDRQTFLEPMLSYLKPLARGGKIETWDDSKILPGEDWDDSIKTEIEIADIIFLLVSVNSLNTDYIWNVEIEAAMRRHEQGTARVIPIILSKCRWEEKDAIGDYIFPPAKLNALPSKEQPIDEWNRQNDAWDAVANAINTIIDKGNSKNQRYPR